MLRISCRTKKSYNDINFNLKKKREKFATSLTNCVKVFPAHYACIYFPFCLL